VKDRPDRPRVPNAPHLPAVLERAYILAHTGDYATVTDIRAALIAEGNIERIIRSHLSPAHIRHALLKICREARRNRRPRRPPHPQNTPTPSS
jgi:hypothetical protein